MRPRSPLLRALSLALLAPSALAAQSSATATAAAPAAAAGTSAPAAGFTVSDLLDLPSWNAGELTADGRWLVATSTTRRAGLGTDFFRDGDPTYVRPGAQRVWVVDTRSGARTAVFPTPRNVRALTWAPDGRRLAMLVWDAEAEQFRPMVWDRESRRTTTVRLPAGRYVAETSDLRWHDDGQTLLFSVHTDAWRKAARARFLEMTRGPVIVQSSTEPFLAWEELRRRGNVRAVVAYDLRAGRLRELVPETMLGPYRLSRDGKTVSYNADITPKTSYDVIGGSEYRLVAQPADAGTPRTLLPTLRNTTVAWAEDGVRYAYARDGRVWLASVDDTAKRLIAGLPEGARPARDSARDSTRADSSTSPADSARLARERAAQRWSVQRFSPAGDALLLSNGQGVWVHDLASGQRERVIDTEDSSATRPRVSVATWSDDGRYLYLNYAERTQWRRGVLRYDRQAKRTDTLVAGPRYYTGLQLSKDGRTAVLSVADGNRPADVYVGDAELRELRRVSDVGDALAGRALARTELLGFRDADGDSRWGVVYYPADYRPGTRYPTVFLVYEEFFDDSYDALANLLAANGYVVMKPSVGFDVGYPGEAWLKGVTAAANELIDMGVADSSRLGVQGTSYGGYAVNLLVTQTDRFRAAVNVSGKVDIISFYTDSPRLGVRNVHAAEKSQDRIGATLWEQPQKYVQHSAVMFADRIKTPLLLMTGDQDHNVPAGNTREMYYALRRLGKEVVWVNYMNGGHGTPLTTVEDFTDYHVRILDWYAKHLKRDGKAGVATNE